MLRKIIGIFSGYLISEIGGSTSLILQIYHSNNASETLLCFVILLNTLPDTKLSLSIAASVVCKFSSFVNTMNYLNFDNFHVFLF